MNRAQQTLLVLGLVFSTLGALALGIAGAQLLFWWDGHLSGLTIEPILVPFGLIFLAAGLPKLRAALRTRWLERHGQVVDAEVLSVRPTRQQIDRMPVVHLTLQVRLPDGRTYATSARWPLGFEVSRLVPGGTLRVRVRPGRPGWVAPA